MSSRSQLVDSVDKTFTECLEILKIKNHDYAGEEDSYKNFRFAELVGLSVERAILVRMSDKLARISNCLDKDVKVKDETVSDTLSDLINYTAILKAYLEWINSPE